MQPQPTDGGTLSPISQPEGNAVLSQMATIGEQPPQYAVVGEPRSLLRQLPYAVQAMRPRQWVKNGLVLLALVFSGAVTSSSAVLHVAVAFAAFCLAASTVYLINDMADRKNDRLHPRKQHRPIASGKLSLWLAAATALVCAGGACLLTYWLVVRRAPGFVDVYARWGGSGWLVAGSVATYVVVNLLYSFWLKHIVLWDVFAIAFGFVLRALVGAFAIPVPISPWFYLCTTFFALFLALGKRRTELATLNDVAGLHRRNLQDYTLLLLDQLIAIVVTCALITYSMYTFKGLGANHSLMLTIPVVTFGLARYLYLVYVKQEGDQPDEMLYSDWQILGTVSAYVVMVLALIYVVPAVQG